MKELKKYFSKNFKVTRQTPNPAEVKSAMEMSKADGGLLWMRTKRLDLVMKKMSDEIKKLD